VPDFDQSDQQDEAYAEVATGRRDQRLVVEGWFASHADSGTPGPHLHLRTSDRGALVVRTDQVDDVVAALREVADRIERLWERDGDAYARDVVLRSPDPQDPRVVQAHRRRRLELVQRVRDHLPDVVRLLTEASSTDEALASVAGLLGVDEADAMVGLARFDLLALTRPATERRLRTLAEPD
jgi:hypothetical protein